LTDRITPGLWYIKVDYAPGYDVVSVMKNMLSDEGELMVFSVDHEGAHSVEDYGEELFICPVPGPGVVAAFRTFVDQVKTAAQHVPMETGVCCCGSPMNGHDIYGNHSPRDEGEYFITRLIRDAEEALAT